MTGLLGRALRYNVINALQIAVTVTFQILLARTFGASFITDAYLISLLFVTFVSTMASGIAEMFVQYYHEIKEESPAAAARSSGSPTWTGGWPTTPRSSPASQRPSTAAERTQPA